MIFFVSDDFLLPSNGFEIYHDTLGNPFLISDIGLYQWITSCYQNIWQLAEVILDFKKHLQQRIDFFPVNPVFCIATIHFHGNGNQSSCLSCCKFIFIECL